jgi:hypothetical protein
MKSGIATVPAPAGSTGIVAPAGETLREIEVLSARDLGGRPSKYEPRFCQAVIDHSGEGRGLNSFAASIGVCRKTLTNWAQQHEEFYAAVLVAQAKSAAWWEDRARDIAQGNGGPGASTMTIFALKNLDPESYQDRAQLEHIGRIQHHAMTHAEALEEAARRGLPSRIFDE